MRKLLFALGLLCLTTTNAQIKRVDQPSSEEIGKIAPMGSLSIKIEKSGDTYNFLYQDVKFTQIKEFKSFSFKDVDNAFEELYKIIMDGFDNPPADDIMIELPEGYLWLGFTKALGVVNFRFGHSVTNDGSVIGFSQWLTKKQTQKLFGKR
ncbi:hypothetical protein [Aegicerativicinus sediminis]|uniref:hypothetical protein n=1 Tax=Aegicerativicinus sediminis TaxID=2893202 RepID=UPI001E2DD1A9|nr:hypothetical protein [Aegicerativicinus sediminis]